ncbi:hypothetical protein F5B22DRAFT_166012 [Xylaria bambusicola]|uniref:uncharacterized protein n=1 Tax=Xylaria bambusicola TaxID=326684 RepID=UPI002007A60E|nr:uncharacterized protein F5B22DRAFT_166012 [Xylaria bambusicola]KAI0526570.1 hypothetical protein F5B22DRAFT_166012 [Xylaria bambusicola]
MEKYAFERLGSLHSPNILQLPTTYEVRDNYQSSTSITYNLLFPWADGNLKEVLESENFALDKSIVPWIAEQCWNLTDALKVIHTDIWFHNTPGYNKANRQSSGCQNSDGRTIGRI